LTNAPNWPLTVLHAFTLGEGGYPQSALVFGPEGLLYGVTPFLDSTATYADLGTAFSVSPLGDQVEYKVSDAFGKDDSGFAPYGITGLPQTSFSGSIGASTAGGSLGYGTIFSLKVLPSGAQANSTLYSFGLGPDVNGAESPPILGKASIGNQFFGCAVAGGIYGRGGIYRLAPNGNHALVESVLYSFGEQLNDPFPGSDGCYLVQGSPAGKLYGTTEGGGAKAAGSFYELDPPTAPGGQWTETVDVSFAPGGSQPLGAPVRRGSLYYGPMSTETGNGAIYELTP
jgi:hypothetical protein